MDRNIRVLSCARMRWLSRRSTECWTYWDRAWGRKPSAESSSHRRQGRSPYRRPTSRSTTRTAGATSTFAGLRKWPDGCSTRPSTHPTHLASASWSPVRNTSFSLQMYFVSKTLAEQAAWDFAEKNNIDFISIIPTLVNGPFIMPTMPPSMLTALALITST